MRTVVLTQPGGPENLLLKSTPKPVVSRREVLIKVTAAGINRADIVQRKGHYPAPRGTAQDILGLEVSGIIEERGGNVTRWEVGDAVCALLPGEGYAEYVAVDEGSCLPIPKGFSLEDVGGLPEVLFTVWHNVFQRGRLQRGQKTLIYGGSGGIGSMAIQLVKLFGAEAYTLASSTEKLDFCKKLGAEKVINYQTENLLEAFGSESMDVILDSVGGDYLKTNLELLKKEGHLVYINAMGGGFPTLNIFKLMQKRLHLTGSTLRARSVDFKKELADEIREKALPLLESEHYKNIVTHRFPVEKVVEAHQLMDSRDFFGKIILLF